MKYELCIATSCYPWTCYMLPAGFKSFPFTFFCTGGLVWPALVRGRSLTLLMLYMLLLPEFPRLSAFNFMCWGFQVFLLPIVKKYNVAWKAWNKVFGLRCFESLSSPWISNGFSRTSYNVLSSGTYFTDSDYEACAHERKVEKRVSKFPSCKNSF